MNRKFPRSQWFRQDRFGMFIHWGLYAIPARGEWVRSRESLSQDDYQPFFDTFDPTAFDPAAWARVARQAGMRYMVLTAKHHDGFCLFDSALTDYKATNTPAGRDLVREILDAFRAEGLKVGLYYSLLDWHHPDYPYVGDRHHPLRAQADHGGQKPVFDRYLAYLHGQVRELCTHYGRLDIMWFDFSYDKMAGETWRAAELVQMVRTLQPQILIDNRLETSGSGFGSLIEDEPSPWSGDFASPEQIIPPAGLVNRRGQPIPWEACITMNKNWGYCAGDHHFKPAAVIVRKLVECVSKGGNLLLNVGPDAYGRIPQPSLGILSAVGTWMRTHGSSIYGCGYADLPKPEWGRYTRCANRIYAHVTEVPIGPLHLPGVDAKEIKAIRYLGDGSEVRLSADWMTHGYPGQTFLDVDALIHDCMLPDPMDTVFEVELLLKNRQ